VELLTGNKVKRFTCAPFQKSGRAVSDLAYAEKQRATLRGLLTTAMTNKRLVCAATPVGVPVPGVSSNHAYAVLEYDAARDEALLWNPHSNTFKPKGAPGIENGYPTETGKFRVPLAELVQFFTVLSFETDAKLKSAIEVTQPASAKTP